MTEQQESSSMLSLPDIKPRYLRLPLPILLLLALLPGMAGGTGQQVSMIDIPVRLSLDPLIGEAEKMLPRQAGNWR